MPALSVLSQLDATQGKDIVSKSFDSQMHLKFIPPHPLAVVFKALIVQGI